MCLDTSYSTGGLWPPVALALHAAWLFKQPTLQGSLLPNCSGEMDSFVFSVWEKRENGSLKPRGQTHTRRQKGSFSLYMALREQLGKRFTRLHSLTLEGKVKKKKKRLVGDRGAWGAAFGDC